MMMMLLLREFRVRSNKLRDGERLAMGSRDIEDSKGQGLMDWNAGYAKNCWERKTKRCKTNAEKLGLRRHMD